MKNFVDNLVSPSSTLQDVITVIDKSAAQIALVVDLDRKLLGVITDGDIRRALLRGESLDSSAEKLMHKSFRTLSETATENDAFELMRREMLHQVPVVDESGKVTRLFLLEDLIRPKERSNTVVIMAGGEGKRLRPFTQNCPKPMLRVGGKPLLEIIIEQCISAGFENFYLAVNYLKEQIQDYFIDGSRWNIRISYIEEDQPLGTAGALSLISNMPSEPFLVLNGDVLTRIDYGRLLHFHKEYDSVATLCVRQHTSQIPYGVVQMDDLHVLEIEEKPIFNYYVNAGIYLLDPTVLNLIPKNKFFDMPQLLEKLIQQKMCVSAFPLHEYWLDVGRPDTFERARKEWIF